ncbi:MAG: helix-turn-helix domain-containing protein [Devosia sp.]
MQKDPDFVTALARGLSILTCFQAKDIELGNGEIAKRASLPPATVARLTYTLTQLGYLRSIPHRRKYALSAQVLSIGYPVLASLPERELARTHVKKLADETGGSVCLAVAEGLQALYIEASRGADAGQLPDIGTSRPLLDSSVGRALFVDMESAQQESVLNQLCLIAPGRADELRRGASDAREDYARYGMCRTEGVAIAGWSAVAMPLRGLAGRKLALSLGLRTASVREGQLLRTAGASLAATSSRIAMAFKAAEA